MKCVRFLKSITVLLVIFVAMYFFGGVFEEEWRIEENEIVVQGDLQYVSKELVIKEVKNVAQGNYFTMNIKDIRQSLLELPWVQEVGVRRQWPLKLTIDIDEKMPVAVWNGKSLLSNKGELFGNDGSVNVAEVFSVLPKLDGPQDMFLKSWQQWQKISLVLQGSGLKVETLNVDSRRSYEVSVIEKEKGLPVTIKLGRNNMDERINRFLRVFDANVVEGLMESEVIDLRYPNGMAIKKRTDQRHVRMTAKEGNAYV